LPQDWLKLDQSFFVKAPEPITRTQMNPGSITADRPLPEGVRDLLFADAAAWRTLEAELRRTWNAWGYREIILPTFEYAATLATDVGAEIDAEMYRFFDRQGRTLALRPDMTIPTARVVGTRLYDQPMPLRIGYVGSVYRYEPPRAGLQHEFTQAGVELIGAQSRAADAETVALAVAALRAAGLPEFRVTLGHVGFFRGLLAALALPDQIASGLRDAVNRKAEAELASALSHLAAVPARMKDALMAFPRLTGGAEVLRDSAEYCVHPLMESALEDLRQVAALLEAYGVAGSISYDMAEVRDLDYYTGITYEGFAPGLGFSLISGGRYDDLIGHFGPRLPAVGWALTLDRVLLARETQGVSHPEPVPDVLLFSDGSPECLGWADRARRCGLSVEVDALGMTPEALWTMAVERRIPRVVWPAGAGRLRVRDASGEHVVLTNDVEEVTRWR
jgi:ATP phosphoribosyltransferase regulatory subunit